MDLTEVIADAVNDATVSAPGHRWLSHVPKRPVWVSADRAKSHQLIANLLSNARVHTPVGTTVSTRITTGRPADGASFTELTVTDDGPGISREVLPHLFERFVRADKSRSSEAGSFRLGLAIVASIVEAHHGSIMAVSDGGYTTFRVRLPMIEQDVSSGSELSTQATSATFISVDGFA